MSKDDWIEENQFELIDFQQSLDYAGNYFYRSAAAKSEVLSSTCLRPSTKLLAGVVARAMKGNVRARDLDWQWGDPRTDEQQSFLDHTFKYYAPFETNRGQFRREFETLHSLDDEPKINNRLTPTIDFTLENIGDEPILLTSVRSAGMGWFGFGIGGGGSGGALAFKLPVTEEIALKFNDFEDPYYDDTGDPDFVTPEPIPDFIQQLDDPIVIPPKAFARLRIRPTVGILRGEYAPVAMAGKISFHTSDGASVESDLFCWRVVPEFD